MRALTLLISVACAACSYRTNAPMYDVHDASVPFALAGSIPANGAGDVGLDAPLILTFTDYPDDASIGLFGPISLRSGRNSFDFDATVDLLTRTVVLRPRTRLMQRTQYTLLLTKEMLSLGGMPLDPEATISFMTGTMAGGAPDGGLPPVAIPRTLVDDVQPIFDNAFCAVDGCHAGGVTSMAGLDLTTAARSAASLIDTRSSEMSHLARVKPGDPTASYLLRKLLGTSDIAGGPMPLGSPALPGDQLRIINDWIATGAQ